MEERDLWPKLPKKFWATGGNNCRAKKFLVFWWTTKEFAPGDMLAGRRCSLERKGYVNVEGAWTLLAIISYVVRRSFCGERRSTARFALVEITGVALSKRLFRALKIEHSERNWLNRRFAVIGVPQPDRDFIGRWRITSSADECQRLAQRVVINAQEQLLTYVAGNDKWGLSHAGVQEMENFLRQRQVPEALITE
eukprot:s2055_g17.t1